ncbi:Isoprenylcysteine carboxyl methyltransferase (ICMT) family protein [Erythrobacter litoralis]|uniref:Protein-S-isoprenylcysteine methyltransferase n=1 Tax=Erythrobacter litoralis TaxID=39960 RepID=A0A074MY94_9SPHN|nr:isoprenylcysteine carboxylmethyltransferase family protein [Erythrobacter litoralis]AOL24052.1 Isoprenylcysteine carboxyl methyltransferase (ICMT) family protein [Erythrobacter litoralis]KEO98474.1 protein-S-isoprenylcysteine methyltransferase [Erythrobacter litoralis]
MSAESLPSAPARLPEGRRPESDVSAGVGLAGLLGLLVWILVCRTYPLIADTLGLSGALSGARGVLSGPYAALAAMVFTAGPMVAWSVLVDRVHLRPSTGIDWTLRRPFAETWPISLVKLVGLWATFAGLAALYGLGRWYWDGSYVFAMEVLAAALIPLMALSVPYVLWLDRFMVEPRDSTWHFGAMIAGREGWEKSQLAKHWRAWLIKGFFSAFMISILPGGFAQVVEASPAQMLGNPVELAMFLVALLFVIDVQIGTVGYLLTLRPLDAHIRSGNPFLGGWIAALLCYPPFVWGIIGNGNQILSYERNVAGWGYWLEGQPALLWLWAGMIVFLTLVYAWATIAFGIRFSNLTYRGVLTNGPYRFTRHPAYLSKNLFWWLTVMPFLVTSNSAADAVRNCFFLLLVNAIYYWRARTEEAHLLAEDAKYREYHAWMDQHGLITAPLARLVRAIGRGPGSARGAVAEPAE